jgi:HAD superfamily hydrolase (TIGR01450 family)
LTGNGAAERTARQRDPGPGDSSGPDEPGPRPSSSSGLKGCQQPLSEHYDAALLDLDGVVYLGGRPIAGAADALTEAAKRGMKLAYVTNNASRSPNAIAAQLTGMGVRATAADIVTSAQAAAHVLADRLPAGAPVLVVGGTGLRLALRERGLRPVSTAADRPLAVVQGYSPDISYGLLAEAALALNAGAFYVASNADPTLPTARGLQPGNGSLVQVLVHATGREPVVAGKPEPPLHAESVQRVGAQRPVVVGDRLDTDIEGAVRGGADSLLVLTGVTGPAELLLAGPQHRPSYVAADLAGLNASHPDIRSEGGSFSCGGWTVAVAGAGAGAALSTHAGSAGGWLTVSGSGSWIDGLRTLCAAAWSAAGAAGMPAGGPQEQRHAAEAVIAAIGPAAD